MLKTFFSLLACMIVLVTACPVYAQDTGVIAVVNDLPITNYDVDQRIALLQVLNQNSDADKNRKKVANDLINDVVKISEAKRNRADPTEQDVDDRLKNVAASLKLSVDALGSKLNARGVKIEALKQYLKAQMSFGRLLNGKFQEKIEADPGAIDKKLADIKAEIDGKVAKVMADPRMQPVTVYSIMEVNFPSESGDPQLLQSRAIEAGQYLQKFKSCAGAGAAASGIFNVKVGKKIEADGRRLPAQLKALFDSKGPGHAYGPMRYAKGMQVIAFCGTRKIVPKKPVVKMPTRQQIENVVLNEKFDAVEQKYVTIMRKTAIIEYKDQAYAQ